VKKIKDEVMEQLSRCKLCLISGQLYRYIPEEGYWKLFEGIEAYKELVATVAEEKEILNISKQALQSVIETMKLQADSVVPNVEIQKIKGREEIAIFQNGAFQLDEGNQWKRIPAEQASDFYMTHKIKADYIPCQERRKEDGITFENFVKTTFPDDVQHSRQALLEIMGYIVSNFLGAKKAFFLVGYPSSGKSVILQFMERILGQDAVSHIDLDKLGMRFNIAELAGKKANLSGEVPSGKIKDIASFKKIVGKDTVMAEFKGQNPFSFRFSVKLLLAGNQLPDFSVSDGSASVVNRMHVLYFPKEIEKEKQDESLLKKLLEEKDYIVSEALDAAANVKKNGYRFTLTKGSEKLLEEYCEDARMFERFISNSCEKGSGEEFRVYKADLWDKFSTFCQENGVEVLMSKKVFYCKVAGMEGIGSGKGRISGGKSLAIFHGMRMKENKSEKEEQRNSGTKGGLRDKDFRKGEV
jgi:putative DNA primase/helicase